MQWYPSKIDWWIATALCIPPLASVTVLTSLLIQRRFAELPIGIGIVLFVLALYLGLIFPMRYGLDQTHLVIRFGLCRKRIRLADVMEVRFTCNPLSSPALSLSRLRVQYGTGMFDTVMISPRDRDHFMKDLAHKAGLKRQEDRLYRNLVG
jgi:hypothetical protein